MRLLNCKKGLLLSVLVFLFCSPFAYGHLEDDYLLFLTVFERSDIIEKKILRLEQKVQELQAEMKKNTELQRKKRIKHLKLQKKIKEIEKNQLVAKLDATTTKAACEEVKTKYFEVQAEIEEVKAEIENNFSEYDGDGGDYYSERGCWTCSNEGLIFGNRDENGVCVVFLHDQHD